MDINFLKENGVDVDKSLELFGDMNIYNETFQDYLNGISEKLSNLARCKNIGNWSDYAVFAHSIKSDARYLGFTEIAQVCLNHEMAGKEQNQHFIENDYNHLLQEVDKMTNIIQRYLQGEKAQNNPQTPIYTSNPTSTSPEDVVIIADDSKLITNFVTKVVECKYKIIITENGRQTIDIIENSNYHVVGLLLDLNMPVVGGFEVLEYIKDKQLKIPTTIITGEDSKDMINKSFTYNIVDMLVKPFSKDELNRVIEKTINYPM